jgi:hypothetical protein
MIKIVRKLANTLATREDRDNRRNRNGLFVSAIETERANLENIGRAWCSR